MLLTLVKSTQSSKGGHILKLQAKKSGVVANAFGTKEQNSQITYYMKVATVALQVGQSAELDLTPFEVVSRPHTITENGQPKEIQLKWLQLK